MPSFIVPGSGSHRVRWRWPLLSLLAVVLAAVALLVTPPAGPASPRPVTSTSRMIGDVWPVAKVTVMSGVLPGGASYEPLLFTNEESSIGLAVTQAPDGVSHSALVAVVGSQVRVLRDYGDDPARVRVIANGADAFWLEIVAQLDGTSRTSVWRASLAGGPPTMLVIDEGRGVVDESVFDLALADRRLHWVTKTASDNVNELHSVAISGGDVSVRRLPGSFTLRNWPWAALPGPGRMGQLKLLNLDTEETIIVAATDNQVVDCTSEWCRVTTLLHSGSDVEHGLMRPDGSGYKSLSRNDSRYPVGVQPLLLNRFEFQAQAAPRDWQPDRLWLLDLVADRTVLASASYSLRFGTHDSYVWWSSGDDEALQWNLLDLRQLAS